MITTLIFRNHRYIEWMNGNNFTETFHAIDRTKSHNITNLISRNNIKKCSKGEYHFFENQNNNSYTHRKHIKCGTRLYRKKNNDCKYNKCYANSIQNLYFLIVLNIKLCITLLILTFIYIYLQFLLMLCVHLCLNTSTITAKGKIYRKSKNKKNDKKPFILNISKLAINLLPIIYVSKFIRQ